MGTTTLIALEARVSQTMAPVARKIQRRGLFEASRRVNVLIIVPHTRMAYASSRPSRSVDIASAVARLTKYERTMCRIWTSCPRASFHPLNYKERPLHRLPPPWTLSPASHREGKAAHKECTHVRKTILPGLRRRCSYRHAARMFAGLQFAADNP